MKIIKTGQDARDSLKRGLDKVADCVKVTLGASGRNAIIGRQGITPLITNDGVSIARSIELEDEFEELGAMIVKEASTLADINGGDGTTTATVLLQAITTSLFEKIKDSGSLVKNSVDTIKLKKEVDEVCEKVVNLLKDKSRKITKKEIYNVAKVSAEYDWLSKIITEVFEQVGVDGYVTVEEGVETKYNVFNGLELPTGYHSDYFANNGDECVMLNPKILVTNQRLMNPADLADVIADLIGKDIKELIVVAPDFSQDLLNRLVTTKLNSGFACVALKLPTFDKDDLLIDLAMLTNSKFLDKNTYTNMELFVEDIRFDNLGTCEVASSTNSKSVFKGGNGDVKDRVIELRKQVKECESHFDKDKLEKRIAYLSGGFATIKIGSYSDNEKTYYKLKAEDAVNAVQRALKSGVVKGGGLALLEVANEMEYNILTDALKAPYNQIQKNGGGNVEILDTIIDPVDITISSLKSACSLAGNLITTEVAIAYKNERQNKDEN